MSPMSLHGSTCGVSREQRATCFSHGAIRTRKKFWPRARKCNEKGRLAPAFPAAVAWCLHRLPPHPELVPQRSEEHTSELQSLMRISYAVFCLKKKTIQTMTRHTATYELETIIKQDQTPKTTIHSS